MEGAELWRRRSTRTSLTVFAVFVGIVFVFWRVVGGGYVLVPKFFYGVDVQHDVVLVTSTFALGLQLATEGHRTKPFNLLSFLFLFILQIISENDYEQRIGNATQWKQPSFTVPEQLSSPLRRQRCPQSGLSPLR